MKMKSLPVLAISGLMIALSGVAMAQNPPQLTALLAKMDAASQKFKSAQADFKWENYQRVVHDTSTQTGTIYFQRDGAATDMGAAIKDPGAKLIEYKGGLLKVYDPGPDQLTVIHAGNNQAEYESFLTLGFGGSGSELAKTWNITDQGAETIDGVQTEKLGLVAKDPAAQKNFKSVTIWVDPARAISLKQLFVTPSNDTRTSYFTNIRLNGSIDKGRYAIKTSKKTQIVNH